MMSQDPLIRKSLEYHKNAPAGKTAIRVTKPCSTQEELSLAYTPGVAYPCLEIEKNPETVFEYTNKGNLVGVISNGTAVLGLGDIGPAASKPVMEGKGVLFKRFADIDVFDIEISEKDPERFIEIVKSLEPTFGGINLEDIKAPECFLIEERLKRETTIPVFHDDQHGTAVIVGAGLLNALELAGKKIDEVRVVFLGAGAAGIACAKFIVSLGVLRENILLYDSHGLVSPERRDLDEQKRPFAQTGPDGYAEALRGADVFIGLSRGNMVTADMVRTMERRPVIFALANPFPEIPYEEAAAARPDVIMATGRSDYPNQINNVLGFPYIFRGALDISARGITEGMKIAAARALARLAKEEAPSYLSELYKRPLEFGPDYIIPVPFDRRVLVEESSAVAMAAMAEGIARKSVSPGNYRASLETLSEKLSSGIG
jgi:malate dehydrogenase (oxaloacetate-decarboxylating)(NADP+)